MNHLLRLLVEARQAKVAGRSRCLPRRRTHPLLPRHPRRSQPLKLGLRDKVERRFGETAGVFSAVLMCRSIRFRTLVLGSLYRVDRCASAGVG
ncbi:hypothetical protein E2C01_000962 [Portunus trituberculatus]|uniref:Uncharacterized protein n=1 Tax=Portunus trituberculatus TaxID=210409 RepID=A0A5B7CGL1_PORTR|nr:hypothetical protein [Portunus trituberculatus]